MYSDRVLMSLPRCFFSLLVSNEEKRTAVLRTSTLRPSRRFKDYQLSQYRYIQASDLLYLNRSKACPALFAPDTPCISTRSLFALFSSLLFFFFFFFFITYSCLDRHQLVSDLIVEVVPCNSCFCFLFIFPALCKFMQFLG